MRRREFLTWTGASALALGAAGAPDRRAERPNILWLTSEDNGPFLGCYGDTFARTPAIDRLAREGVLFESCFAEAPVCAPSRFALITGMHAPSCGPAHQMRAQGKIPAWLRGFPAYLREAGYFATNNAKTDYNAPIRIPDAWDKCGRGAHWRDRARRDQPFFGVFNHEVTHESCLFPEKDVPLDAPAIDPAAVRLPPYHPDTAELRADWARYYDHLALLDRQIARKLKELEDDGIAENTIVFYFADNGGVLPRSKRFLQASGTRVPLIVRFPPKWQHLAPAAPGSRIKDPVTFVDFGPTVLSLAGVAIPDRLHGRAFAGAARAPAREFACMMRNRMDERYDMMRAATDGRWLYIRNYRPDIPPGRYHDYMYRARGYQSFARLAREGRLEGIPAFMYREKPAEELYDLVADPHNVANRAADPALRPTLERLRAALERHILAINDNGFIPEGSPIEGYDASRAPGAYPIERVLRAANAVADRNPARLPEVEAWLRDGDANVRWWAALGCLMLREKAAPARGSLDRLLGDPSGPVQIAAAEALCRMGGAAEGLPVLSRRVVDHENGFFALQAANALEDLEAAALPALPALQEALAAARAGRGGVADYLVRILSRVTERLGRA